MAALANTQTTVLSVGNKEELSDVVSRITPEDTPVYSMIGKGKTTSVHPEWETDELAAPGANRHTEGDEYTFSAITPPERMGNYTQILRKEFIISNTQEEVDEAGNVQKTRYQKLKKGVEIKKDVEYAILAPQVSIAGANRQLGGLPTWVESNVSRGAGGSNGGFSFNTGLTTAPGDGTQRAFDKTTLDSVMQQGYESGANFKSVSVSPYVKSVFVSFMSNNAVAPFRHPVTDGKGNTIIANADYYHGPFGMVAIVPNRVQVDYTGSGGANLSRNAFFIDPSMVSFLWLRKIHEDKDVAKTGDAKKTVLIGEGTLKVHNEAGIGVAADLYGMSSSS